jgi:hypothetical protein
VDIVEFKRLTARVIATRNAESRAFLQAFDVNAGTLVGWSEDAAAKWRTWTAADMALRGAVAQLETFLVGPGPAAR